MAAGGDDDEPVGTRRDWSGDRAADRGGCGRRRARSRVPGTGRTDPGGTVPALPWGGGAEGWAVAGLAAGCAPRWRERPGGGAGEARGEPAARDGLGGCPRDAAEG